MRLKIKSINLLAGKPVCIMHKETARKIGVHLGERVLISKNKKNLVAVVDLIEGLIKKNEMAVSNEIIDFLNLRKSAKVNVSLAPIPPSVSYIKKKLNGGILNQEEIFAIVKDIATNYLRESEVAFFISAVYQKKMNMTETKYLVEAMVKTGNKMKLRGKVADKHCIGGVAGNRTTPIVVSICAATGLIMPKTSSRAITSAAGTADTIETLAKVDFPIKDIKKIIKKTNACFVWGGALGLAPSDDKIIKIERTIKIDSVAQLLASILSKKISVDSEYILIDIPYGKSAKVSKFQANKLKSKFLALSKNFNLKLEVILTNGSEPIGRGVGPSLEMKDVIAVLKNQGPEDLKEKCLILSGQLLEMVGKAKKNIGYFLAREILESGGAYKKFEQIIKAQRGKIKNLELGPYSYKIKSTKKGKIKHLNNKLINSLARYCGCPEDKASGVYLNRKKDESFKKGDILFTLYAQSIEKLEHAKDFYNKNKKEMIDLH